MVSEREKYRKSVAYIAYAMAFMVDFAVTVLLIWLVDWTIGGVGSSDRDGYVTWLKHLGILEILLLGRSLLGAVSEYRRRKRYWDNAERTRAMREAIMRAAANNAAQAAASYGTAQTTIGRPRVARPVTIEATITDLPKDQ